MEPIYVWPDSSWMPVEEYDEVNNWRGDDFFTVDSDTKVSELVLQLGWKGTNSLIEDLGEAGYF